jgi:hypothetical protein
MPQHGVMKLQFELLGRTTQGTASPQQAKNNKNTNRSPPNKKHCPGK